jgi:hypothetical protein
MSIRFFEESIKRRLSRVRSTDPKKIMFFAPPAPISVSEIENRIKKYGVVYLQIYDNNRLAQHNDASRTGNIILAFFWCVQKGKSRECGEKKLGQQF